MEILLHSGLEHPNTLWIAAAAVISFVLGVVSTTYGRRIAAPFRDSTEE
ncbi:hypothetical protein [Halorubrum lacusprofundi]|jgi:uncharacterized protein YdaL|uniref:Uncharacterized protein n=1 Tax=Halorubrum lacusprofundi (strain ATCC 49239 / DSM 5036 / JCM 8891 / ACAM 34) TaxID=416348 RepID=B9LQN0_HALLT|nr:hypothetical protein [Halorubrum lacusprofundi]ACM55632.1 conserved hypothetical protein [Halorubrum lacusprofundi ATCC 49239]MCG1007100.1 hypothetical protein [Halorubrum lacusprofundi]